MDKIMIQKLLGIASGGLLVGGILLLLLFLAEQWHNVQTFLAAFFCIVLSCLFYLLKRQFYETDNTNDLRCLSFYEKSRTCSFIVYYIIER